MSKLELLELLQQGIKDVKGLINYKKLGLTEEEMKKQAREIILNLQEHLEELVQN